MCAGSSSERRAAARLRVWAARATGGIERGARGAETAAGGRRSAAARVLWRQMCGAQFLRRAAAPAGRIGCVLRRAKAERRTNAARLVGDEAARKRAQGEEAEENSRHISPN